MSRPQAISREFPGSSGGGPTLRIPGGSAQIVDLAGARSLEAWPRLWTGQRHDDRFFEIVEGTIAQGFDHRYLVLRDESEGVRTIQPFFICAQNLLQGIRGKLGNLFARLDRAVPGLAEFRMLMVGSSVGEGVLAAVPGDRAWCAKMLVRALPRVARRLGASIIVLKEFSSDLRGDLAPFAHHGYARLASLPYVALNLDFRNFDDHLSSLSKNARKDFRRKFRAEKEYPPLSMEVVTDISSRVDELYPLYLQVYERSTMRFEKLTPDFFRRLGREMSDRARFFIWTMCGRPVGFYSCLLHEGVLWIDYMGMDYDVALDLHLYFVMKRDALNWGCRNGVRKYCGGPLNYDPKLRLGCRLQPMDLYASHVNPLLNGLLTRLSPWLSPVRYEPILKQFPNAEEL